MWNPQYGVDRHRSKVDAGRSKSYCVCIMQLIINRPLERKKIGELGHPLRRSAQKKHRPLNSMSRRSCEKLRCRSCGLYSDWPRNLSLQDLISSHTPPPKGRQNPCEIIRQYKDPRSLVPFALFEGVVSEAEADCDAV